MGDVQQQIADGARPRLARVGDRIEHGGDIPANVVLVRDQDNDLWRRGNKGFACLTDNTATALNDSSGWWPVTVVEVDPEPQPVEPERDVEDDVHYYVSELRPGTTFCGIGLEEDNDLSTTDVAGKATCDTCRAEADEDAVKSQPACFKCGQSSGRVVEVAAAKPPRFMHAYGSCESDGEVTERVANTFGLEWPRPESQSAAEVLDMPAERKLIGPPYAHRDAPCTDACYEPEPVEISTTCNGCGNYKSPPDVHKATCPTRSGPLVLTLPQVPDGAVVLVGETTGTRYEAVRVQGIVETCWMAPGGAAQDLGVVLDLEARVTVEMAPPREPRTWPKLDDAPDDLPAVRGASGRIWAPHDSQRDALWCWRDGDDKPQGFEPFVVVQYLDGPVTEVLT